MDPYTWTFNHKDYVHFIFYQGSQIIGYAHIQLWPESKAILRIIVLDETFRNLNFGSYFLALCEKWLKRKGIEILHTEASPAAKNFYLKNAHLLPCKLRFFNEFLKRPWLKTGRFNPS